MGFRGLPRWEIVARVLFLVALAVLMQKAFAAPVYTAAPVVPRIHGAEDKMEFKAECTNSKGEIIPAGGICETIVDPCRSTTSRCVETSAGSKIYNCNFDAPVNKAANSVCDGDTTCPNVDPCLPKPRCDGAGNCDKPPSIVCPAPPAVSNACYIYPCVNGCTLSPSCGAPIYICTPTNTPTATPGNTSTPTQTPTNTPTPSNTPTRTPTPSNTPTQSPTFTPTPTHSPTQTPSPTPTVASSISRCKDTLSSKPNFQEIVGRGGPVTGDPTGPCSQASAGRDIDLQTYRDQGYTVVVDTPVVDVADEGWMKGKIGIAPIICYARACVYKEAGPGCSCSYRAPALSPTVSRGQAGCGCVPADGSCTVDPVTGALTGGADCGAIDSNTASGGCKIENKITQVYSATPIPGVGNYSYQCGCRWQATYGNQSSTTSCSFEAQAYRKSITTDFCTNLCSSIGATSGAFFQAGYCACGGVPVSVCPTSAMGSDLVSIATMPESCMPAGGVLLPERDQTTGDCVSLSCPSPQVADTTTCSCKCPTSPACAAGQYRDINDGCSCKPRPCAGVDPKTTTNVTCCEKAVMSCTTAPRGCAFSMNCQANVIRFNDDDACPLCRGQNPQVAKFNQLPPLVGMQASCHGVCPDGSTSCCPTYGPYPPNPLINNSCQKPYLQGIGCQIGGFAQGTTVCVAQVSDYSSRCANTIANYPYPTGGGSCTAYSILKGNRSDPNQADCNFIDGTNDVRCTYSQAVSCN